MKVTDDAVVAALGGLQRVQRPDDVLLEDGWTADLEYSGTAGQQDHTSCGKRGGEAALISYSRLYVQKWH